MIITTDAMNIRTQVFVWIYASFLFGKFLGVEWPGNMVYIYFTSLRSCQDFPGGQMVKNPPANAGDMSLIPGPGRSHMPRATKPGHLNHWAYMPKAHTLQVEAPPQWEVPAVQWRPSTAKIIK